VRSVTAGQILVSEVLRSLARGRGYDFASVGELTLKGLPEALPSSEVACEPLEHPKGPIPLPAKIATAALLGLFGREQGGRARVAVAQTYCPVGRADADDDNRHVPRFRAVAHPSVDARTG
jgi:hypothetical protein